jgi:hypothetical protein
MDGSIGALVNDLVTVGGYLLSGVAIGEAVVAAVDAVSGDDGGDDDIDGGDAELSPAEARG